MPRNPLMQDGGQNLSQLLMALGSGFSMASAANQPWWAGIGPAAGLYGQAQQQAEDRAYRQQQIEQNNQYRQLQEEALRAQIDGKRKAEAARMGFRLDDASAPGSGTAPAPVPGMAPPVPKPVMGGGQNVPLDPVKAAGAIGTTESGNNYRAVGPVTADGDRAWGKFQVMGKNIGPWTQEVLGTAMTPEQFLNDDKAQDAVFNSKFGAYANKYGPEGAARAWFAGEGGMNNPNAKDVLGTTVASYGRKFADLYGMQNPEAPPESYRGPGTNPMPAPPVSIAPPPPMPGVPAVPPSPVVLTGGQAPVPMTPGAAPQQIPPPPEPVTVPFESVNLPPQMKAALEAAVQSGEISPADARARAYQIKKDLHSNVQADAKARYDQKMKLYELQYGEAVKIEAERRAAAAKIEEERRAAERDAARRAEDAKGDGSYEYLPDGRKVWISKADRAKGGIVVGDKPDKDLAPGTPTGDIAILETGDPASRAYSNAHKRMQSRMIDGPDGMKYLPDMSGYRTPTFSPDGQRAENTDATGMVPVGGNKAIRQGEDELRKEFENRQNVKAHREVVPIIESAEEAIKRPTRAADLNLIYALGKVMDPNSVVREGEMVMARGTGTVQDYIGGLLGQLNGGQTLKDDTRRKLVEEIKSRAVALERSYNIDKEAFSALAERRGFNVNNVITPVRPDKPKPTVIDLNGGN